MSEEEKMRMIKALISEWEDVDIDMDDVVEETKINLLSIVDLYVGVEEE